MASLAGLLTQYTDLGVEQQAHLRRLVTTWSFVADFCFSDLLLLAPVRDEGGHRFVVLAHVRPNTGQTNYPIDVPGTLIDDVQRPLVARVWKLGEIAEAEVTAIKGRERIRLQCIPVRFRGEEIAVLTRESSLAIGRRQGALERAYLEVFDRIARMVADGTFPFEHDEPQPEDWPRVGDGVILLDEKARLRFVSPNAVSALHRCDVQTYTLGERLKKFDFDDSLFDRAFRSRSPASEEISHGDVSVLIRAVPLLEGRKVVGGVALIRDVTDLRRRDRMLVSKDATIREIHHRVKNNLQTIAALLRMQSRRIRSDEGQVALSESERRIRAIAMVHETLAKENESVIAFNELVDPLVEIVEESVKTPEGGVRFTVEGDAGSLPGEIATPLAVVLNELMQNAVDHAFTKTDGVATEGHVIVRLERRGNELTIEVSDDGVGLPPDFSVETATGLGISIVKALVENELGGKISVHSNGGTVVRVEVPLGTEARTNL